MKLIKSLIEQHTCVCKFAAGYISTMNFHMSYKTEFDFNGSTLIPRHVEGSGRKFIDILCHYKDDENRTVFISPNEDIDLSNLSYPVQTYYNELIKIRDKLADELNNKLIGEKVINLETNKIGIIKSVYMRYNNAVLRVFSWDSELGSILTTYDSGEWVLINEQS